jgi:hypothetical protein
VVVPGRLTGQQRQAVMFQSDAVRVRLKIVSESLVIKTSLLGNRGGCYTHPATSRVEYRRDVKANTAIDVLRPEVWDSTSTR